MADRRNHGHTSGHIQAAQLPTQNRNGWLLKLEYAKNACPKHAGDRQSAGNASVKCSLLTSTPSGRFGSSPGVPSLKRNVLGVAFRHEVPGRQRCTSLWSPRVLNQCRLPHAFEQCPRQPDSFRMLSFDFLFCAVWRGGPHSSALDTPLVSGFGVHARGPGYGHGHLW